MTDEADIYLQGILKELEEVRARGGKGVFRVNDEISGTTAIHIQRYFMDKPEYYVEIRHCQKCKYSWDVMVLFNPAPKPVSSQPLTK